MGLTKIKKGLNLPITGEPEQKISAAKAVKNVAILGDDFVGMKPTMIVKEGDIVKLGEAVFTDKKIPAIKFTSPGSGKVTSINRGEKRVFLSLVVELDGADDQVTFSSYSESELSSLDKEKVKEQLLESGHWTSIRVRPFSKIANPETVPHSIFVNAMDTNPLAPSISVIMKGSERDFENGLKVISKLTDGKVFICREAGSSIPGSEVKNVSVEEFSGPHPAGLSGTHIHFIDSVSQHKFVWYINAEDVIAIGSLFTTGKIKTEKVISLAGPQVNSPRLLKTRVGASITELVTGELKEGENRVISGSVLSGRIAEGTTAFIGKFHRTISVLQESYERKFLGWANPFANFFSLKRVVLSSFIRSRKFDFTTDNHGGERAIVPCGSYESVMPLDILPTFLLRSIAVDDVEEAEKLGVLELDEEDLALCTFVDPSKIDHGPILRRNLTLIEKEG
ncbi:MAG: Na(+)-translocating NADH-quinone reductase subunit A [Melioribacteraceae bacterium]|nr:Na(+)-translocating NADH-quinone reductase subunit A [Melioribacteraceae bacterium]